MDYYNRTGYSSTHVNKVSDIYATECKISLTHVIFIFIVSGELETICVNRQTEQEFLNPSIGTYLNDETGKIMKQMFFNKVHNADVVFNVDGMLL